MSTFTLLQLIEHESLGSQGHKANLSTYRIESLSGSEVLRERLQEMGLTPGTEIQVIGRAPFNGPVLIRYDVCDLALREEEALCLNLNL